MHFLVALMFATCTVKKEGAKVDCMNLQTVLLAAFLIDRLAECLLNLSNAFLGLIL